MPFNELNNEPAQESGDEDNDKTDDPIFKSLEDCPVLQDEIGDAEELDLPMLDNRLIVSKGLTRLTIPNGFGVRTLTRRDSLHEETQTEPLENRCNFHTRCGAACLMRHRIFSSIEIEPKLDLAARKTTPCPLVLWVEDSLVVLQGRRVDYVNVSRRLRGVRQLYLKQSLYKNSLLLYHLYCSPHRSQRLRVDFLSLALSLCTVCNCQPDTRYLTNKCEIDSDWYIGDFPIVHR